MGVDCIFTSNTKGRTSTRKVRARYIRAYLQDGEADVSCSGWTPPEVP